MTNTNNDRSSNAGCLGFFLSFLQALTEPHRSKSGAKSTSAFPYRRKDYLLTRAERSFHRVLLQIIEPAEYHIYAKIRLADLLWISKGTGQYQTHFNRIKAKHIDFILCNTQEIRPVLAIELDDASHNKTSVQKRDAFVNNAFKAAKFPLLRVVARNAYNPAVLKEHIDTAIRTYE